jgi:hypothetical protein
MSDYSLDMSVESPKTTPLPIHFPKPTVAIITDLEDGEIGAIPVPPRRQTFDEEFFPLSPQSTLNILHSPRTLNPATLCSISISLCNTTLSHTNQHNDTMAEVGQLRCKLTQLRAQQSQEQQDECPEGYEENHRCLPNFYITTPDGEKRQACYIKLLDTAIPCALGTMGHLGDPISIFDLYTASRYTVDQPTEPLPTWFLKNIQGNSASYHQVVEAARQIGNWGLLGELGRFHKADTHILNIQGQMHALEAKLHIAKAVLRQARVRMEGAQAHQHLAGLYSLDTNYTFERVQHLNNACLGRGWPRF